MPTLPAWLLNKWTLRAIGAAAVIVLLLGARHHYLSEGRRQGLETGHAEATQQLTKDTEELRKHATAQLDQVVAEATAKIQAADARTSAAIGQAQVFAQAFNSLVNQRTVVQQQVAAVPDSQIHQFLKEQLGAADRGPFTTGEERQLAQCVTQYPLCQKQLEAKVGELEEQKKQTAAAIDKQEGLNVIVKAWQQHDDLVTQLYARLWNDAQKPRRAVKCLYLWKCAKDQLQVPAPSSIPTPPRSSAPQRN